MTIAPGLRSCIKHFHKNRNGSVAIEYGLIAVLIAVAIFGAVFALGQNPLVRPYEAISETLDSAGS